MQQHAATFFALAEAEAGADLPLFVKDEFDVFLECDVLAHGFLRRERLAVPHNVTASRRRRCRRAAVRR